MREGLKYLTEDNKSAPLVYAKFNGDIIGWGLHVPVSLFQERKQNMVYIKREFRRQGIGTRILKRLPRACVLSHDDKSEKFFETMIERKIISRRAIAY
tara:strand:- start:1223 stop:1516 length:294 start_codon:yes stop_codon:yes gene_type:complete